MCRVLVDDGITVSQIVVRSRMTCGWSIKVMMAPGFTKCSVFRRAAGLSCAPAMAFDQLVAGPMQDPSKGWPPFRWSHWWDLASRMGIDCGWFWMMMVQTMNFDQFKIDVLSWHRMCNVCKQQLYVSKEVSEAAAWQQPSLTTSSRRMHIVEITAIEEFEPSGWQMTCCGEPQESRYIAIAIKSLSMCSWKFPVVLMFHDVSMPCQSRFSLLTWLEVNDLRRAVPGMPRASLDSCGGHTTHNTPTHLLAFMAYIGQKMAEGCWSQSCQKASWSGQTPLKLQMRRKAGWTIIY